MRLADGLRTGCGFAPLWQNGTCGPAEIERTPGYPLFLAVLPSLRSVLAIQAVLSAGTCLLIGLFAWRHWGLAAGIITESLTGFDLSSIASNNIGTEILFTWIIIFAILLQLSVVGRTVVDVWSITGMLTAAFLVGIGALVRPIGQVLLIIVPLGVIPLRTFSPQKKLILSTLALLLSAGVIVSWSYRNYLQRGIWTFSTIGAINLNYYLAAGVQAYETNKTIDEVKSDRLRSVGRESGAPDLWSKTFDEDPAEMRRRAAKIVFGDPLAAALVELDGLLRIVCMLPNRLGLSSFLGHRMDRAEARAFVNGNILSSFRLTLSSPWLTAIRALLSFQLILMIFMWVGVGLAVGRLRGTSASNVWLVLIPLCAVLLLLLAAAGPEATDRFRVPAMPMLALLAAFGWTPSRLYSDSNAHKATST
jgi:hypothetical protein